MTGLRAAVPTAPSAVRTHVLFCVRCRRSVLITDQERREYTRRHKDNRHRNSLPECCGRKMCCLPTAFWTPR